MHKIYSPRETHLGGTLNDLNYYIHLAKQENITVNLSNHYIKGKSKKYPWAQKELLELLIDKNLINITENDPTEPYKKWNDCFIELPFCKSKYSWKNNSKIIAYQFDGKTHKCKNFPSTNIENLILDHIKFYGYEPIRLGNHLTLNACSQILSNCLCLVCIDSGFGWLAKTIGTPIFFTKNCFPEKIFHEYHDNSHFHLSDNYIDLINNLRSLFYYGFDYYKNNCFNKQWIDD
jgi:hypothetical protein